MQNLRECLNRICDRKELKLRAEREKKTKDNFELQKLQFPGGSNYTQNPKLSYEHSLSGFPSQSRRNRFPVTVGGIPFPKTEYLKRKSLIQRRQNSLYLAMDGALNHSIKMPHLQTQFDKR
ncbi:hypothetical protein TNCV_4103961 [Trichonephila clavipes]|nr:hypothetical protein TNCV_4103961 [Trichonephila clavipes]